MKVPKIIKAVGYIDDDLITAAAESGRRSRRFNLLKCGTVAACFAVLIIAGTAILPSFFKESTTSHNKYKYFISGEEADIEWPWEYKTASEKYTAVYYNGKEYAIKLMNPVSEDVLSEELGYCDAEGTDSYTDRKYTETFKVYKINDVSEEKLIAAGKDGAYYVYAYNDASRPLSLGEMMELYGLPQNLKLNDFTVCKGFDEAGNFRISDDSYILDILSECKDAALCDEFDSFERNDRSYLSFTVTSDALGVYKRVVCISEDGYFTTNIFDFSYTYFIGKDAAGKIIDYAKNNSVEIEFNPYTSTVSGTLTEIGDGYVLIDDSILCTNKEDRTIYKVYTNDMRIKRCIECTGITVGDTVAVNYDGEISEANEISRAYSMYKGTLVDGDIAIPE
ncbi:MAG: hypothetical protein HFE30_02830 [Clostridiales bacterium]|nr:hypothetical protein [Clostridiales bacterium]